MIEIYIGATANPSTNVGGWGAVVVDEEGRPNRHNGSEEAATQNRMILKGAIEALSKTEQGCEVKIFSNSEYLVLGINDSRQRRAHRALWSNLEELLGRRHVEAEHIRKHKWLGEAHMLARDAIGG